MSLEMDYRKYTIVFIRRDNDDSILLGLKKRGFLKDLFNGFGGKLEPGETPADAAVRELEEECGLTSDALIDCGTLVVDFPTLHAEIYLFSAFEFTGQLVESEEMRPQWFKIHEIPYWRMRPDTIYWLPYVLAGKRVRACFQYCENDNIVKKFVSII